MNHHVTAHDHLAPDIAAAIEAGVMEFNVTEGPMAGAAQVFASATDDAGELVGGAVGRRWGAVCELLYLWVKPEHRRHGLGSALLGAFECQAARHGCRVFILDTFSFQAPAFYRRHGYAQLHEMTGFPEGQSKFTLHKVLGST